MNSALKWALVLGLPLLGSANADTLYLCQSYGGGQFWSSANCHNQSATVKRMVTVPDGLPFDQQVQLGEQQRAEGRRLATPAARQPNASNEQTSVTSGQCATITDRIRALDGMARQPQSMQMQDWIRRERKQLTDAQFRLHC
ncbi:MAG: hypothetical protein EPN34_12900 [Burkholderiaceae bacterium]|nr:MAG: hypothetical protein EPN34_12900 [Burkholderiaceae bacterium]